MMRIPDDTHFELRNRMYAMRATSNYLCEKLGRSVCYFSARLNGKKPWDLEDVYNLCDILRIPYDEIPKFFPRDGKSYQREPEWKGKDVKHDS